MKARILSQLQMRRRGVRATKKFFDSNIKKSLKSIDNDVDKIAFIEGLADRVGRLKVLP